MIKIDPDVAVVSRRFGGQSEAFARLIQSVVNAEGNILRAVQISIPTVATREQAIEITCRSAVHAMADFLAQNTADQADFVEFWQQRWAPIGVDNDPHGLNRFWASNVLKGWLQAAPAITPPPPSNQA